MSSIKRNNGRILFLAMAVVIGYAGELLMLHRAFFASDARTLSYVLAIILCLGASLAAAMVLTEGVKARRFVAIVVWTAGLAIVVSALLFFIEVVYLG